MWLSPLNDNDHAGNISLKYEITVSFSISLAVFLFTLFFRPFNTPPNITDDTILFMAGFGGINFFFMFIFLSLLPRLTEGIFEAEDESRGPALLILALILIFDSVAFGFYIRYVGRVPMSMYLMFKVILLCLGAVAVLKGFYMNKTLNQRVVSLEEKINEDKKILEQYDTNHMNDVIDIFSENHSEKVSTTIKDLILLRSADNYVEIIYLEEGKPVRKLIRNTLKNMEYLLARYQKFIRCHRSYIINLDFVEKLLKKFNMYSIRVRNLDEELPVSRQYLLRLRDALGKE